MTPMMLMLVLLWIVVICLSAAVLALARQVGVLHERVAPAGALLNAAGTGVGEPSPRLEVHALAGNSITMGGTLAPGRALLLVFVSQTCPVCKNLIPIAKDFAKSERLEVRYVGDAEVAEQKRLTHQFGLAENRFVNGPEIGMAYRVDKLQRHHLVLRQSLGELSLLDRGASRRRGRGSQMTVFAART